MLWVLTHFLLLRLGAGLLLNETDRDPPRVSLFNHMTASFGVQPDAHEYRREGKLMMMDPNLGCVDSVDEIANADQLEGAVVLVKRGECEFFKKCWAVQLAGAVGCIVGNNQPGDRTLIQMQKKKDESRDLEIPAIFVTEDMYLAAEEMLALSIVEAIISHDGEEALPFFPNLMKIVTYLLIVFPAVWAMLTIMHFCRRDIINRRARNERRNRNRRIPEIVFTKGLLKPDNAAAPEDETKESAVTKCPPRLKRQLTNSSCPICLTNFEEKTKIKMLPCHHGFHSKCIDPWIGDHSDSCPICRTTIMDKLPPANPRNKCCPCWQRCVPDHRVRLLENQIEQPDAPLNPPSNPEDQEEESEPAEPNPENAEAEDDIEDPLVVRGQVVP